MHQHICLFLHVGDSFIVSEVEGTRTPTKAISSGTNAPSYAPVSVQEHTIVCIFKHVLTYGARH